MDFSFIVHRLGWQYDDPCCVEEPFFGSDLAISRFNSKEEGPKPCDYAKNTSYYIHVGCSSLVYKKSPTGPTERTPQPDYLIALAT